MRKFLEKFLYPLGLKQKLMLFVLIIIIFIVMENAFIIKRDYNILSNYKKDNNSYSKISLLKKTIRMNNQYLNDYLDESVLKETQTFNESTLKILSNFNDTGYKAFDVINEIEKNSIIQEEYLLIHAIKNAFDIYRDEANVTIRQYNDNITTNQYKVNRMYNYIIIYIDQLLEQSSKAINEQYSNLFYYWNKTTKTTIIVVITLIAIITFIGIFFSDYLTKNIKQIIRMQTKIATGELEMKTYNTDLPDEMGELNRSLNNMQISIKKKIDHLNEKAIMEKRLHQEQLINLEMQKSLDNAKYAMLQSQINPHFLFNTLNIICRKAMFQDSEEAVRLIQALSELFRHTLMDVSECVSLKKELEVIEKYMYIQKTRYGDRIEFNIDNRCSNMDILIPPLILQPMVENAIIHGLENKEENGKLTICIEDTSLSVIVTIIDDGVGIDEEKIKNIMNDKRKLHDGNSKSIGIINVKNRMRLFTKREDCFCIKSKLNEGTSVEFIFPK
ncbi:hypothetical protein SH1V18_16000 [Vallitalea longa]|uniref:HAMP domain-containing protein n=1 Tax=Vallitalea longa TaxID=2936439 RepID=A0A9W5YAM1_9FIRM|nr:histidine kinase [Vallitalea longa]GKX29120.1 hypothetical protein SH1V18_16000 [Vallitalea longa]